MTDEITLAVQALIAGDIVALPTETVYGLAASIESEEALCSVFRVKGRPLLDPLIVHVLDGSWVSRCAYVGNAERSVQMLTDTFWPGPLTIILKKKPTVSEIVTAGLDTVALRCPAHKIFLEILARLDVPLAAPSANPFGYLSPTTAEHVRDAFGDKVKIVVDGGKCSVGVESTIVDMTGMIPRIVRPGAILTNDIARVLDTITMDYSSGSKSTIAPGQFVQHYSPHTKLVLFDNIDNVSAVVSAARDINVKQRSAFVCLKRPVDIIDDDIFWLSEDGNLKTVASSLFNMLQVLDKAKYDIIYCQRAENRGIGVAINDRLSRASAKFQ